MTRKAKVDIKVDKRLDTQELRKQAAALGAVLSEQAGEAGKNAIHLAEHSREWATPKVEAAAAWAGPRADKVWRDAVKVGAPKVEAAAERVRPAVDSARDRLVDDYLPRVSRAMHEAAAAAGGEGSIQTRATLAGRAAQKAMTQPPKKQHRGLKTFGWILVGSAAAGTGYLLWRRTQPVDDPWAEEYWDDTTVTSPGAETAEPEQSSAGAAATGAKAGAVAEEAADAVRKGAHQAAEMDAAAGEKLAERIEDAGATAEAKGEEQDERKPGEL